MAVVVKLGEDQWIQSVVRDGCFILKADRTPCALHFTWVDSSDLDTAAHKVLTDTSYKALHGKLGRAV